ncbi:hypothetical protein CIHG_08126 [Coccidioides immitis H538.4]|uniref:Uncharacterized protein n=1 Tax=Coccidioides immitis H538.4 TaxID=396776 RepID=A0A0J8RZQ6_COCIT|nr:hypothetical protein CIHG_08126 [Coccidioides immitis H538.4]
MSAATTISGQPRLFDALMHPAHISGIHSSDDGVFLSILLQEAQSSYLISPLIHNPQGLLPFIGGAGSHNHQIMYHTNKGWVSGRQPGTLWAGLIDWKNLASENRVDYRQGDVNDSFERLMSE